MTLPFLACQFSLAARRTIQFPQGMAGNVLRGALGSALRDIAPAADYTRVFRPSAGGLGPSGLADRPRPFVLRAASLDGATFQRGDRFFFGLNLFDARDATLELFARAFGQWADLLTVEHSEMIVDLSPLRAPVSRVRIDFQTPTELKTAGEMSEPDFSVLVARARDRISTLRSLYGAGPLEIDFRALTEQSSSVKTAQIDLRQVTLERRSSRTGQRHGIGGFIGFAEYEGDLAEFVPYLKAAYWTGVGRHCTWGTGQIATTILNSAF